MKIELNLGLEHQGLLRIVTFAESNEVDGIQSMQIAHYGSTFPLRQLLASFMDKVAFAEQEYDSDEDESIKLYKNGFVEHVNLGRHLVVLSYKERAIHMYCANQGVRLTHKALESLIRQLDKHLTSID